MTTNKDQGRLIEAALRSVLPETVPVVIEGSLGGRPVPGVMVRVRDELLSAVWVQWAWLSTVDRLLAAPDRPDIIVADRIPPGSRASLSAAGVGWVETSGAAHIETDTVVVSRSGTARPSPAPEGWTPAVLSVAEAVLAGASPTVSAASEASGLSEGATTKALRLLTDLGYLESDADRGRYSGRRLTDPNALLDAYTDAAHRLQSRVTLSVGVTWRDPVDGLAALGRLWDAAEVPWVATGLVAASVVAPHVTSIGTAEVYVSGNSLPELEMAARAADVRSIDGGRLILSPFPTSTTLRMATTVDELRVAPWPRLVADLRRSGVRGEDAAEHLRKVVTSG